ncbi:SubName: Full=Uncharacterized protein {ECO:0000313/EMBL:KIM26018.1} [Serendipita indica DSM 11827]|nr:SubName: Full=Uncharacterized protein {ECO:0000313/EMBL:KIM26018.1} [Serendipita indica DSM 11827]
MDRVSPLLPSLDPTNPAMASCTSLTSLHDESNGRRPSGSSLVARPARMSTSTRQKSVQQVLHSYRQDLQSAAPLRRNKQTTAPTSYPREQSNSSQPGRSNRDSLEMSLDAWNMDATKKTLQDRRSVRKRESHIHHYTVSVPYNAGANALESPTTRHNGEAVTPFVLPPSSNATVTPTKAAPPSFFSSMFSNGSSTGSPRPQAAPRTPSSTSPARPSTVRRIARTLLEWNLGPQTDLSRWQRDSPRATRDTNKNQDEIMEDNTMRSPD